MPEQAPFNTALFGKQARIDKFERYDTGYKYGEMSPQSLSSYLRKSEEGYLDDWPNICTYALETDSHLASLVQTRVDRVAQAPFQIVPGKSHSPDAQAQAGNSAEFVRDVLSELDNFEANVKSILDSIGMGVTAHELEWIRRGGANVVSDIIWRHSRRFRWDDQWNLRLYDAGKKGTPGEQLISDKWIVHVSQDRPSYPGRSGVIRVCIWPWLFRRWCTRYWIHATERYGQPNIHAYTPENTQPEVKAKVLEQLENLSYDSVGAFETGTEIIYNGGPGTAGNGEMFVKFMDHAKAEMSAAVLGAEDITTPGTHGSQSAVDTRVEATLDPRTASDAKALAATLREQMFGPLLRWNLHLFGGVMPPIPKMLFGGKAAMEDQRTPDVRGDDTVQQEGTAPEIQASRVKKNPVDSITGSNQMTLDSLAYQNPIRKALSGE